MSDHHSLGRTPVMPEGYFLSTVLNVCHFSMNSSLLTFNKRTFPHGKQRASAVSNSDYEDWRVEFTPALSSFIRLKLISRPLAGNFFRHVMITFIIPKSIDRIIQLCPNSNACKFSKFSLPEQSHHQFSAVILSPKNLPPTFHPTLKLHAL